MMNTQQQPPRNHPNPNDGGCADCQDKDNATQFSINVVRAGLCTLLYETRGLVNKAEAKFNGENIIYKEKRCIFIQTEKSYQRFRNFDITAGTELLQTNDSLKGNVAALKDLNKTLNATLNNLFKQVKDVKTKFSDLKDAACKLDSAYKDKCNSGQKKALTGKGGDNCDDQTKPIDACEGAGDDIGKLICIPKGLAQDIDSIFQASSDVIGIQIFSNIDTLDQLQKDLSDKSVSFEKLINDAMKARRSDLDKLQDELVASVKSITLAAFDRNNQRATFEGYYDATEFLCCPSCKCVASDDNNENPGYRSNTGNNKNDQKDCNDDCPPRLKDCEKQICDICGEVKVTFCCIDETTPVPPKKNCS